MGKSRTKAIFFTTVHTNLGQEIIMNGLKLYTYVKFTINQCIN